jgi:hypothetical protein
MAGSQWFEMFIMVTIAVSSLKLVVDTFFADLLPTNIIVRINEAFDQ